MAPKQRKACSPCSFGRRPWSLTAWASRFVRSLAVRAAESVCQAAVPRGSGPRKRGDAWKDSLWGEPRPLW